MVDKEKEKKLGRFEEEVASTVAQICKTIDEEVQSYRAQELDQQENETLAETYKIIQNEVGKIAAEKTKIASRRMMELKKKLYQKRDEYNKFIFAETRLKLSEFVSGPDYPAFLLAKSRGLLEGRELEGSALHVRPDDLRFEHDLLKVCEGLDAVVADETILIGGAKLVNRKKNFVADETLDTALEDQKEWFASNSGFIVTM